MLTNKLVWVSKVLGVWNVTTVLELDDACTLQSNRTCASCKTICRSTMICSLPTGKPRRRGDEPSRPQSGLHRRRSPNERLVSQRKYISVYRTVHAYI